MHQFARITVGLFNLNRIAVPAIAPYALDVLASALEADGHQVHIIDLCQAADATGAIDDYFARNRPDLVCVSMRNAGDLYFPSMLSLADAGSFLPSHVSLVDKIKEYVGADRILAGGIGFSVNPLAFLSRLGLRYGVRGRGEHIVRCLASRLGRLTLRDLAHDAERFVFDGRSGPVFAPVKRTHVDNRWYYEQGGQAAIRTAVGCALHCSYCAEPVAAGHSYAKGAIAGALGELDQLVGMGVGDIQTADSEFNMPLAHSKAFLTAVVERRYRGLRLWAYCQPRPFDETYVQLLAEAGVVGINFGTDHIDADLLGRLGKWYTAADIAHATRLCQQHGIAVMHELLFGSPGDTPEKMYRAIDFVRGLGPRVVGVTIGLGVFPETPLGRFWDAHDGEHSAAAGFYCAGEPMVDPTFYVDPAFRVPEIFDSLADHVGSDQRDVMVPTVASTSAKDNQLVNSDRVREQLLIEKRKGPSWYHFPDRGR